MSKLKAYDLSTGNKPGTTPKESWRAINIQPPMNEQTIMIAWGACKAKANAKTGEFEGDGTIRQWDDAGGNKKAAGCKQLYNRAPGFAFSKFLLKLTVGRGDMGEAFYFNGGDELSDKLGDCVSTRDGCRYDWDFVSSWLGKNQTQRLTQGLMSMIVAFVFLFVLGPMAIGLMLISVALAGLAMILPLSLLLTAMGLNQGQKLLKLTGAAAGGQFIFTVALTALNLFIEICYTAIDKSISPGAPNLFEQVAKGAAPLAGLWLFKTISKLLGLGDISKMTGALGFAGAAALKATGDRDLSRNAAERISGAIGRVGVGKRRLGALDERSLQRRMLNNRVTRAGARTVGHGAKRLARPVTRRVKDGYQTGRAAVLAKKNDLMRKAVSGSPAQRAAAYAGTPREWPR